MMKKCCKFVGFCALLAVPASAQPPSPMNAQDAMDALGALMGGGSTNAAVHFRRLKELIPAEYMGMERSNTEAGKNSAFGMNISYAEAEYANGDSRITVKISDISSMGQFMMMAQFAWTQAEIERESDSGYERTTSIDGYTAQESYKYADKSGKIQVMVDNRFIVEASGRGVEIDDIKGLLNEIGLKRLASLKNEDE